MSDDDIADKQAKQLLDQPVAAPAVLAPATGVGAVHIGVTDGERARRFYRDYVGLTELPSDDEYIHMGAAGRELVVLHPGASRAVVPHTTGLYHLAIVVPERRELARVISRLSSLRWEQFPTDHVMTKANYIWDPDGNGIEIYVESPEDGTMGFANGNFFAVDSQGRPRSGRDPIDLEEMFSHLQPDDKLDLPMPAGTKMGHVHLHVADVDDALRFYHDLVGFDVMGQAMGAAFVSAGGYHHHLGLNIWAGAGAPPAPADAAGLRRFTIELPARRDLEDTAERLARGGVKVDEVGADFAAIDPSANPVVLTVGGSGSLSSSTPA
jgi:catechol 2,3-dioxygenase